MNNSFIINNIILIHIILISFSFIIIFFKSEISNYLKIIDYPDNNLKIHKLPTPRLGGIILFFYILPSLLIHYKINHIGLKDLIVLIILSITFFIVGLIDDRKLLSATYKSIILITLLLLIVPISNELIIEQINFRYLDLSINLKKAAIYFTIFSIFALYNAFNFTDGVNCVASSLGIFWITFIFLKSDNYTNFYYQSILVSLIIIFYFNYINKFFLGNSGTSLLSIIISLILIQEYKKNNIFCDEIFFILFLPGIDMIRISVQRIMSGNSPFLGDTNHIHHLMRILIKEKFIFLPYLLIAVTPILIYSFLIKNFYLVFALSFAMYFLIYLFLNNLKKSN
jgi:UDP-GlcNAc:undecaprenyl-phosphate GlcNAc-1-phosphate transferase